MLSQSNSSLQNLQVENHLHRSEKQSPIVWYTVMMVLGKQIMIVFPRFYWHTMMTESTAMKNLVVREQHREQTILHVKRSGCQVYFPPALND
jgi:hypothetical protein